MPSKIVYENHIEETQIEQAVIGAQVFLRRVANNSGAVSYWCKQAGNVSAPHNPADLHFTLGVITGDTAQFHATVNFIHSYYRCKAMGGGAFNVTYIPDNNGGSILTRKNPKPLPSTSAY